MKSVSPLFTIVCMLLVIGCSNKESSSEPGISIQGTTWAMHLIEDSYNYIWFSCDSTYIFYDDEIENRYYGDFKIGSDTLWLFQKYEDDYHKYGSYPVKKRNLSILMFSIINDSTIELVRRDEKEIHLQKAYTLKHHFNCYD